MPHFLPPHALLPHALLPHALPPHALPPHALLPHALLSHALLPHALLPYALPPHVLLPHVLLPHALLPHALLPHELLLLYPLPRRHWTIALLWHTLLPPHPLLVTYRVIALLRHALTRLAIPALISLASDRLLPSFKGPVLLSHLDGRQARSPSMCGRSQAHQGAGGSGAHHHHHHADDTQPTAVGGRELAAERVPSASPSERAPDRPTVDLPYGSREETRTFSKFLGRMS